MNGSVGLPRLHLVTDDGVLARPDFARVAEALLRLGGERVALHLRGPRTSGRELYRQAAALAGPARNAGALLLVNDRVDVALAAGASGVQLGERGLPVEDARRMGGAGWMVGASVHDPGEAGAALERGADFVLAGTLFASASHPGRGGSGVGWLREIPGGCGRVIGIGGVDPARVAGVLGAGAHGVAVIRAVWGAEGGAEKALRAFLEILYEDDDE